MKIGIITNEKLAQFLIKTFEEIGYESYWISIRDSVPKILQDFNNCDIIYAHAPHEPKVHLLAKLFRKKIVTHWIGTDAFLATTSLKFKYLSKLCNLLIDKQLVVSSNLKNEIESIGIKNSVIIPILPKFINEEISKIEQKNCRFTVLSYTAKDRYDFYGSNEILKLAQTLPDIDFWILSSDSEKESHSGNIRYLGIVPLDEMNTIYEKCHVLIRYVKHDGMPKMLLEALLKGLQVIYSFPFPNTYHCTSFEQMKEKLHEIKNNYKINYSGREYVQKNYNSKKNNILFKQIFDEIIYK